MLRSIAFRAALWALWTIFCTLGVVGVAFPVALLGGPWAPVLVFGIVFTLTIAGIVRGK